MTHSDDILREQIAYYNARAQEYDATAWFSELKGMSCDADIQHITERVAEVGHVESVLELAPGTGAWTSQLAKVAQHITAIDGAQEMIDTNRAKLGDNPRVTYQLADLFEWQPTTTYDLVLTGFFLSHVPPDKLASLFDAAAAATQIGGRVMIIDEHAGGRKVSGPNEQGMYQTRTLQDGSTYQIIKVYYDPAQLRDLLAARGFDAFTLFEGECFFALEGVKSA
jgi:ubiquinone/menaquinone biosynthesis C-methylase UbiE